ncbi:hypothetical protein BBSC_0135 [Bifidobacterium scardovii JCM 12489 = DSM 13734]|nr:hypothetical protein BBSC_0135 [Bifidobacterium scardovii JCM 12489 = DSM 13734]
MPAERGAAGIGIGNPWGHSRVSAPAYTPESLGYAPLPERGRPAYPNPGNTPAAVPARSETIHNHAGQYPLAAAWHDMMPQGIALRAPPAIQ